MCVLNGSLHHSGHSYAHADGVHLADFVNDWCEIPFYSGLTIPGWSGSNIGSFTTVGLNLACIKIDFSVPRKAKQAFVWYNHAKKL